MSPNLNIDLGIQFSRMMNDTPNVTRDCHFFTLPGELRNKIYDYIISDRSDNALVLTIPRGKAPATLKLSPPQPPLARTCRQIRDEVLSIFYGDRTFTLEPFRVPQNSAYAPPPWTSHSTQTMQPSLYYLRNIIFHLFDENGKTQVDIHAYISTSGRLEFSINATCEEICCCRFQRCALDVEKGVIGSREDPVLVRFMRAWDLEAPGGGMDRYSHCGFCGKENAFLSLWRPERGEESGSESDDCERVGIGVP